MSRVIVAEYHEDGIGWFEVVAVSPTAEDDTDADWRAFGFLPDRLAQVPGVLREWRNFQNAAFEALLRFEGIELERTTRLDGGEYDLRIDPDED